MSVVETSSESNGRRDSFEAARPPVEFLNELGADINRSGGEVPSDVDRTGAIGATMFDLPGSEDGTLSVLLPKEHAQAAPSQALVRIRSRDGRCYIGVVTAGPFAEPDTLRADSHLLVTVSVRGGSVFLPPYHGRVQISILGEELADGSLGPPRLRPLPNSPVIPLDDAESEKLLKCGGDIRLGRAMGHKNVVVGIPSEIKAVLPRHTAILGTTGGGKSTTVAGLIQQAQAAGMAVVLLDVEGEYANLHQPTADRNMLLRLGEFGKGPQGLPAERMSLFHLVGRDCANRDHPNRQPFSLQFSRLSPYAAMEILGLSEPQQERFLKAYDIAKEVLRELEIFPKKGNVEEERLALEIDEFERGYPKLQLPFLIDLVSACAARADKTKDKHSRRDDDESDGEPQVFEPRSALLKGSNALAVLMKRIHAANPPGNLISWRALQGRLGRLNRLRVFFDEADGVRPIIYKSLLRQGQVSVIDLSDSGYSELNNLVIADLLRGIQEAQDDAYEAMEKGGPPASRVLVIIEEAHEFLSEERIARTPILFQQVARIAKRGRKRWLSLAFVTQLPGHLPRQLFGLVNNYILHKLTDAQVVSTLRRTISGIDDSLWDRLPGLAPGQAIVSFGHMTRPLLTAIDPTPCKLRMVD